MLTRVATEEPRRWTTRRNREPRSSPDGPGALATRPPRRTLEALLGGTLVGYLLTSGAGFLGAFTDSMLAVMREETVGWITLVVGLFGALMALLVRAGGA